MKKLTFTTLSKDGQLKQITEVLKFENEALLETVNGVTHKHKYVQDYLGTSYWGACEVCGKTVQEQDFN